MDSLIGYARFYLLYAGSRMTEYILGAGGLHMQGYSD